MVGMKSVSVDAYNEIDKYYCGTVWVDIYAYEIVDGDLICLLTVSPSSSPHFCADSLFMYVGSVGGI